jgi:hypothetical protein
VAVTTDADAATDMNTVFVTCGILMSDILPILSISTFFFIEALQHG